MLLAVKHSAAIFQWRNRPLQKHSNFCDAAQTLVPPTITIGHKGHNHASGARSQAKGEQQHVTGGMHACGPHVRYCPTIAHYLTLLAMKHSAVIFPQHVGRNRPLQQHSNGYFSATRVVPTTTDGQTLVAPTQTLVAPTTTGGQTGHNHSDETARRSAVDAFQNHRGTHNHG